MRFHLNSKNFLAQRNKNNEEKDQRELIEEYKTCGGKVREPVELNLPESHIKGDNWVIA